jgi:formylglycine-generating enzyme required for sulfatase activity
MKKFIKTTALLFALIVAIFCTCSDDSGSSNNQPDYNMTGTYTFNNQGGSCTWSFTADGKYQATCYGVVGTLTGTWSPSGNDVTISFGVGSVSGKEVFTVQESGNQLTLTLKDNKPISNVLSSFKVVAKSVTMTKTSSSGGNGGGNTAVTLNSVTANGSVSESTTQLTLTFSQAITGFSADDITLRGISGVTKGTLRGSGPTYTLSISCFSEGGSLNVEVAKSSYTISDSTKTVTIFYYYYNGVSPGTIEMVSIPAGTFIMGSPSTEPGRFHDETQHSVTLSSFSMGKYQVTQEQYQAVMGTNPSNFKSAVAGESGTPGKLPVENVSWYDALVFCNKLSIIENLTPVYSISGSTDPADWGTVPSSWNETWNASVMVSGANGYRLPFEEEWEYACRAGTTTAFNNGNDDNNNTTSVGAVAWNSNNSNRKTHQVGLKTANAWGLYDMHGNVWEWCRDWYAFLYSEYYPTYTGKKVLRGGSWSSLGIDLRSASRHSDSPGRSDYDDEGYGFRLVRSGS